MYYYMEYSAYFNIVVCTIYIYTKKLKHTNKYNFRNWPKFYASYKLVPK